MSTTLYERIQGKYSYFVTDLIFWSVVEMKAVAHMQLLHMYERVCGCLLMPVHLTGPWCQLMSVSASVNVKDAVVIHQDGSGMTLFVTVVTDSASLRGGMCKHWLWKAVFVFHTHLLSLSVTHTRAHTHITLLELTTKTCLSNCGGIRLGYKETHKANVSISCSSKSLFVWLIRTSSGLDLRCCLGNDAHKTPQCDVDMFLNNKLAFWLIEQSSVE